MNETLEAMARALFKSWFVDFDPVRAKIALKHRKSITPPPQAHHSPLEGESASQGRQPAGEPVGGRQGKGASPQASRWGEIKRLYSPQTLKRAKALRQSQSNAEGLLWHYLRKKQLDGHKFRRQQPIGRYIVDFVCMPKKLVIELDGGQHSTQKAYDEHRDQFLTERGYRVLRFWNSMVFENCYGVLESILVALQDDATKVSESPPSPSPNHSPLEGESERQGPQPAGEPVGGRQSKGASPKLSRSPVSTPPPGGNDWTVERAKAYLERMPPEIADLFPDRFVPSELGEIPKGWEVKSFGDIASQLRDNLNPLTYPDTIFRHFSIPAYGEGQTPKRELGEDIKSTKTRVPPGAVLLSKLNPEIERVWLVDVMENETAICSTEFLVLLPKPPIQRSYIYCLSRNPLFREQIKSLVTGTSKSHQRARPDAIKKLEVVFPPRPITDAFESKASRLLNHSLACLRENRILVGLRDSLLPRLVSGELRIGEQDEGVFGNYQTI